MKRILLFLNFLFALNLVGQTITGTPVHAFNLPSITSSDTFFKQSAPFKKIQFVYSNTELGNFNTAINASVQINQLWFKHTGLIPPTTALTNFKIKIGHSNASPLALDSVFALNSPVLTTCFSPTTVFNYTVSGPWVGINLTTPFLYDGVSNICIVIEYTNSTLAIADNIVSNSAQTVNAGSVSATGGIVSPGRPYIGFGASPPCPVPSFSLPSDSIVCGTSAITLSVPTIVNNTALYSYQWIRKPLPTSPPAAYINMGTGLLQATTTTTATYILVVSNTPFTCSRRDSITVSFGLPAPSFTLGPDISFCGLPPAYNNTTQLKPIPLISPVTGLTFQWTGFTIPPAAPGPITGIPTPTAQTTTPTGAGQYILTVSKGICKTRDTINLTTPVSKFILPNDTTVCTAIARL
jgi:hypothetical protein